jgi:hypothetical protein
MQELGGREGGSKREECKRGRKKGGALEAEEMGLGMLLKSGEFIPYEEVERMEEVERVKGQSISRELMLVRKEKVDFIGFMEE